MQIYHNYQYHNNGSSKNETFDFTMGVVLVAITDDEFNNSEVVFPPNRLRPTYSMQGEYMSSIIKKKNCEHLSTNQKDRFNDHCMVFEQIRYI